MSVTDSERAKAEPENGALASETSSVPPALLFFAALMLVALGVTGILATRKYFGQSPAGGVAEPDPQPLPEGWIDEFEMTERSEKKLGSKDLLGKVWVANFFFAQCPGSCRRQSSLIASMERDFRDQGVKFVSITCDPSNDSPAVLREYARDFNAPEDWWFLTGDLLYIRRVGAEFFQMAVSEKGHQDRLAVVDKWGKVRGHYNWHDELQLENMKNKIAQLLAETEPPKEPKPKRKPRPADDEEGTAPASDPAEEEAD